jgi:hypothetical protein
MAVVERFHDRLYGAGEMLFRPTYCANCGVKIERAEWRPWTSRRFCQVCEIELKEHELIPKAVVGLVCLISIAVLGFSYSTSSNSSGLRALKEELKQEIAAEKRLEPRDPIAQVVAAPVNQIQPEIRNLASTSGQQKPAEARPKLKIDETPHFCGAETRKGTPCSRRVKGNARCFQHQGMPAMTVADTQEKKGQKRNP